MLALPSKVVECADGSVSVEGLKLKFYRPIVAKSSKIKLEIFGTMKPLEEPESTKAKKVYSVDTMKIPSKSLLQIFDPTTYLTKGSGGVTTSKLMEEHVKGAIAFAICRRRYMEWLRSRRDVCEGGGAGV